eukprot:TRINITY_DN10717_c0_g1_i14.p1 TRINITY_DN10717_c0_g1~~TRINITY_DN10717_c0_g1_i14.p1  ORF type:complete len:402 (-),score=84.45 TRINITY_DN10717_c0_g1_i14:125-1222(-)
MDSYAFANGIDPELGDSEMMLQFGDDIALPLIEARPEVNAQWFYLIDGKNFAYDKSTNEKIEAAFRKGMAKLVLDSFSYINFAEGMQVNNVGGVDEIIPIQRLDHKEPSKEVKEEKKIQDKLVKSPIKQENANNVVNDLLEQIELLERYKKVPERHDKLPSLQYVPPPASKGKRVTVREGTPEYNNIKMLFDRTMFGYYNYLEISKLENPRTLYFFHENLIRITKENKRSVSETTKRLFFSPTIVKPAIDPEVIYNGYDASFDPKLLGTGPWGKGIHFFPIVIPEPSFEYSNANGIKEIILANVITGNSCKIPKPDSTLIYPPQISSHFPKRYDSVLGKLSAVDIYIVYTKNMAYPEYVINYGTY